MSESALHLFSAFGIELEYMIVDASTLDVMPVADALLAEVAGGTAPEMEVELGDIAWSNELALHVIELKTNGPVATLDGVADRFQEHVGRVEAILERRGARLMPTGMHPWMAPDRELRLWPHDNDVIYRTFDRIFDCRGHGWANLQSTHVNLPFADDDEFARLHAAIRMVLPLLPALAASSPIVERRVTGLFDTRLHVYKDNAAKVPSVSGLVVPEAVFSRADYEERLLDGIYRDLAPLDPDGVLRHEWVNARGAIARFDRMAIEIRVLDVQECPRMDLAIVEAVVAAVRAMVDETWCSHAAQRGFDEATLASILGATVRNADHAQIENARFLAAFGLDAAPRRAREVWAHLVDRTVPTGRPCRRDLDVILGEGCLARRILAAASIDERRPVDVAPDRLREVYGRVAGCLARGEPLRGRG